MKIKQLIKKLQKLNPNAEIILSSDSEGNSYSYLSSIYNEKGLKMYEDCGQCNLLNKDDIDGEWFTQEQYDKCKECVVLYP